MIKLEHRAAGLTGHMEAQKTWSHWEKPLMPWPSAHRAPVQAKDRWALISVIYDNASECAGKHATVYFAELMKSD